MNVFLSYHFNDQRSEEEWFVHRVSYHLGRQAALVPYCYASEKRDPRWAEQVGPAMNDCDMFVLFVGREFGNSQRHEAKVFRDQHPADIDGRAMVVRLPDACAIPDELFQYDGCRRVSVTKIVEEVNDRPPEAAAVRCQVHERQAEHCARMLTQGLSPDKAHIPPDGLPGGYSFAYEKDIIEEFVRGEGRLLSPMRLQQGCPQYWPQVQRLEQAAYENPVPPERIGGRRPANDRIIVDTRTHYHKPGEDNLCCLSQLKITFPEAGPREQLVFPADPPGNMLRAGVLVSGGIAPGINAVIDGIVARHELYHQCHAAAPYALEVRGYRDGFEGLLRGNFTRLKHAQTRKLADRGGSMIGTSRLGDLMETGSEGERLHRSKTLDGVVRALTDNNISILYVIGGDGSMRAAHAIWARAKSSGKTISVVGVPKTMDNDILWVWQAFGFLSAVEKAREFVMQLHTEVSSNPRLCIMQLFGSDSGFVVSHTALASGVCNLALIPEVGFRLADVAKYVKEVLQDFMPGAGTQGPFGMILMAETAIPDDVVDYYQRPDIGLEDNERKAIEHFLANGRRVQGQTPDELRTAGLKILKRALLGEIHRMVPNNDYWRRYRVFTNEPRHLLRAIDPSVQDIIFAQRLGSLAVDNAMAGYTDFMISQWVTEYVLVPLELVVLGRKRVPREGIFWKSVVANTGQPRW